MTSSRALRHDVIIVGAGAAGLCATRALRRAGIDAVLLEAAQRIGGRAYTEVLPNGAPFDLGCHWLHSASINPLREVADRLGLRYRRGQYAMSNDQRAMWRDGAWLDSQAVAASTGFMDACESAMRAAPPGASIADTTEREHRWSPWFDFWVSILQAADADQVDCRDWTCYRDTHENWPVSDGYGTLIARCFADVPVQLNAPVQRVAYDGAGVQVETPRGTLSARCCLLTVSTGILNAADIAFAPALPDWKAQAIAALPAGNANRIALTLRNDPFGPDAPEVVTYMAEGGTPMNFLLRPFGRDYVVANTGGRFAWHLERAGVAASADYARERLADMYGHDVLKSIDGHKVTAWGTDPWTKCAYTYAQPGAFEQRAQLAEPVADRLYFAGEATSPEFFTTCHGAYLSGESAARSIIASMKTP